MSGMATPQSSSDNFWNESSSPKMPSANLGFTNKNRESLVIKDNVYSVDEAPDFHDPYSELTLFLSQKIKQQISNVGIEKKWTIKLQEELIKKITPDFQKRFPHYRLGVSALKKTWEKISYYSQQIQQEKEAITQDGKLNIHFFIRENLKQYPQLRNPYDLHPYHYAHKLAVKMSECIAAVDGIRPKIEELTKMVWAVQRHLLTDMPLDQLKSPYDEWDKIDKLIVKTILETTARDPLISQQELEHQVRESLHSLHELPSFASLDKMVCNVSALLAEKLYSTCALHSTYLTEQKNAICNFIRRQVKLCRDSFPSYQHSELVRRILALYSLASGLPKTLSNEEIKEAILASYPIIKAVRPELPQSVYAFISAESVLMKNEEFCHSIDYVIEAITTAYEEVKLLPPLNDKDSDHLEIAIWKILSETEGFLEKLPYKIGQRIEAEIANILIDNPHQSFASIVYQTVKFFKRIKELSLSKKWPEMERKIHRWTIQGDMLCRWIKLDEEAPLLNLIQETAKEWIAANRTFSHQEFVSNICQTYLRNYPELAVYSPQVTQRIWILYKYIWYTLFSKPEESSFDRFLKWHASSLLSLSPHLERDHLLKQLEEMSKKILPLLPFQAAHHKDLFAK